MVVVGGWWVSAALAAAATIMMIMMDDWVLLFDGGCLWRRSCFVMNGARTNVWSKPKAGLIILMVVDRLHAARRCSVWSHGCARSIDTWLTLHMLI